METKYEPSWDDLRVLLAVHRHRSFLAAGRALGISTSTTARRIEALEQALDRPLVHRSSAGTSVEPEALELVNLAEQLELGLQSVRRDEGDATASGTVRLSLSDGLIIPVTQVLATLRQKHPALLFEVSSEARMADLSRREADIGIRMARSASPVLVQRLIGRAQLGLYAARSYVERRVRDGRLKRQDMARHDFIGFETSHDKMPQVQWLIEQGAKRFVFRSNSYFAMREAAELGLGIMILGVMQVPPGSELVRLETEGEPPWVSAYLAYHRELRNVKRIRLVLDALESAFRAMRT
ncbi:LysR family transcriptional regulator [Cystobacter fuscus]|uniref:LysR family transcriptional regulator n=1 Tax=Cystobacter fuscus TaxID=43 RepID=A0A250JKL1_9BACT|nr:LysR family transcriptional regulator [Cystobacter fuscus]ATB44017.1 LysR family transcriptional regulator [Cystobacter fuscus]